MPGTNSHGQQKPTESDAVQALAELVGVETADGVWALSVRALGLRRPVESVADLRRVAEQMMTIGELSRIAGRSLKVRSITFDALSATGSR
jgi:phosphate uptake regulator